VTTVLERPELIVVPARAPTAINRIAHIDGLRAIAVLMVVAHHLLTHNQAVVWVKSVPPMLQHLWFEGAHGVDLFFVLSGFCLSYPFLRKLHTTGASTLDLATYFARRLTRLIPPYYLVIVLLLITGLAIPTSFNLADVMKQP